MHHTDLPKWVATDAITLFAKEMDLTDDELNRAEWTDTDGFINPKVKDDINWAEMTAGNWWVTVDLKAYLFWVAFENPNNNDSDTYLWQQICQGCCERRDSFSLRGVEIEDGRTVKLPLCDAICDPDWWDDTGPGDWVTLFAAYLPDDGAKPAVRLADWMCENCSSVCPYDMMAMLLDLDYEPPRETVVCSSCERREPGRFLKVLARYTCVSLKKVGILSDDDTSACCPYCHRWADPAQHGSGHEEDAGKPEEDVLTYVSTPKGRLIGLCHQVYDYSALTDSVGSEANNAWIDDEIDQVEQKGVSLEENE